MNSLTGYYCLGAMEENNGGVQGGLSFIQRLDLEEN